MLNDIYFRSRKSEKGFADLVTLGLLLACSVFFISKGESIIDNIPFLSKAKPKIPQKSELLVEYEKQAAQFIYDYVYSIEKIDVDSKFFNFSRRQRQNATEIAYRVVIASGGAPLNKIDVNSEEQAQDLIASLKKRQSAYNSKVHQWVAEVQKLEREKTALGKVASGLWSNFIILACVFGAFVFLFPVASGVFMRRISKSWSAVCKKTIDAVESSNTYEEFLSNSSKSMDAREKKRINSFENKTIIL